MKEGALDFLAKPVDPDHLLLMVERALAQRRLATENMLLKEELGAAPRRAAHRRRRPVAEAGHRSRCTARPRPTPPCCSKARAAPARSCSRARCTRSARAPTGRSSRSTARRFRRTCSRRSCSATRRARSPAPSQRKPGQVRAGAPRHAVPRRDRRAAARAAGQDPARARREAVRARRRHGAAAGRRARRRRDQPQSEGGGRGAPVPRGSLLPAVGVPDHDSAAARAAGRHPDAGAVLRRAVLPRSEQEAAGASPAAIESCWPTRGRATCASCRTASSAR